jgi:hypothetical protein
MLTQNIMLTRLGRLCRESVTRLFYHPPARTCSKNQILTWDESRISHPSVYVQEASEVQEIYRSTLHASEVCTAPYLQGVDTLLTNFFVEHSISYDIVVAHLKLEVRDITGRDYEL